MRLSELRNMIVRVPPAPAPGKLALNRMYFKPSHSLSVYAEAARQKGAIIDNPKLLDDVQDRR